MRHRAKKRTERSTSSRWLALLGLVLALAAVLAVKLRAQNAANRPAPIGGASTIPRTHPGGKAIVEINLQVDGAAMLTLSTVFNHRDPGSASMHSSQEHPPPVQWHVENTASAMLETEHLIKPRIR